MIASLLSDTNSIMKKLKNKFILIVIWIILVIVFSQVFIAYSNSYVDTNSYLSLIKWEATLNDSTIERNKKYTLATNDKVEVIGDESLAIIEWWDGSLTRLGWNTKISIEQNKVSRDYTDINISFELIAGKTWSNVVSFIGHDSSFTQSFEGIEAGVRGTIFDVNLENNFVHVTDHQVTLQNENGDVVVLGEGRALNLSNFSLIDLQEFISSFEDTVWKEINGQLDTEYLIELKKRLTSSLQESDGSFLFFLDFISPKYRIIHELNTASNFEDIEKLISEVSESKKQVVYDGILSKYQSMNFVKVKDYDFYKKKIFYKKALLILANDIDKQSLLRTSTYDVEDVVSTGDFEVLEGVLSTFSGYNEYMGEMDISSIQGSVEFLPDSLKKEFRSSFENLNDIFQLDIDMSSLNDINMDNIGEKTQEWLNNLDDGIQDFLDDNVGGLLKGLAQ